MIYFIRTVGLPFVKMGSAINPKKRLREHQMSCPLKLEFWAILNGNLQTEMRLKRALSGLGHRGEWYQITPQFERALDAFVLANGDLDEFADCYFDDMVRDIRDRLSVRRARAEWLLEFGPPMNTPANFATVMPLSSAGDAA